MGLREYHVESGRDHQSDVPGPSRVAIIVVGFDSAPHLPDFFASLPEGVGEYRPTLCLIDNHSQDETAALFEQFARESSHDVVTHRAPANLGFTGGNNLALERLAPRGPFDAYVLVNPDTVLQPGWLAGLLRPLAGAGVGTVASLMSLPDGRVDAAGCGLHFLGFGFALDFESPARERGEAPPTYASGASMAISQECLHRIQSLSGDDGLFWPELYLYHDDLELGWRTLLAGYRTVVSEESRVTHDHQFPGRAEKFFYMERNRLLVLACYYRWRTLLLLSPLLLLCELALLATDRRLGFAGRLRVYAVLPRLLGSTSFRRRRRRVQTRRVRTDREILGHMFAAIEHPEMRGRSWFNRLSRIAFSVVLALVRW
jgi:GT2 family glycosyltransferase